MRKEDLFQMVGPVSVVPRVEGSAHWEGCPLLVRGPHLTAMEESSQPFHLGAGSQS